MRRGSGILIFGIAVIALVSLDSCKKNGEQDGSSGNETGINSQELSSDEELSMPAEENTPSGTVKEEAPSTEVSEDNYDDLSHAAIKKVGKVLYNLTEAALYRLSESEDGVWTETTIYEAKEGSILGDYTVLGEDIYLLETQYDRNTYENNTALYLIKNEQDQPKLLLEDITGEGFNVDVCDGILYLSNGTSHSTFLLGKDGSLKEAVSDSQTLYQYMQEDTWETYQENGLLTVADSMNQHSAIWLASGEASFLRIDPLDGSRQTFQVPDEYHYLGIWQDRILYELPDTEGEEYEVYYLDATSGKINDWFHTDGQFLEVTKDGCYLKRGLSTEASESYYKYQQIGWDGVCTVLFQAEVVPGMHYETVYGVNDFAVIGDRIYYNYADVDKMCLMYRNLNQIDEAVMIGTPYSDKAYAEIGKVERLSETLQSDSMEDLATLRICYERLILEENEEADQKINAMLEEYQTASITAMKEWAQQDWEGITQEDLEYFSEYSMESYVMGFTLLTEKYLCVDQYGYEYTGGVHGFPIQEYYLFDLTTGKQLYLMDVVGNAEKELHDIILNYYGQEIQSHPDSYYEDAYDTVDQTAGENSLFYLTSDGIVFYYMPYSLGCYASGISEVLIPYSEFDMKITIDHSEDTPFCTSLYGWH